MFQQCLLQLAALWAIQSEAKQLVGPYELEVHKVEKCPTSGSISEMLWSPKIRYYNRTTTFISTNFTLPSGLTDAMTVNVDLAVLRNGAWRNNFINFRIEKCCSDIRKLFPKVVSTFMEAAGYHFTGCPIPAGKYSLLNWKVDFTTASGVFPYNTYRMVIKVLESRNAVFCVLFEAEAIPKVTKKP